MVSSPPRLWQSPIFDAYIFLESHIKCIALGKPILRQRDIKHVILVKDVVKAGVIWRGGGRGGEVRVGFGGDGETGVARGGLHVHRVPAVTLKLEMGLMGLDGVWWGLFFDVFKMCVCVRVCFLFLCILVFVISLKYTHFSSSFVDTSAPQLGLRLTAHLEHVGSRDSGDGDAERPERTRIVVSLWLTQTQTPQSQEFNPKVPNPEHPTLP